MICDFQGPVLQSIVRLTSLLVVKLLTVLLRTVSNLQVFLLKKSEKSFSHFFSKNITIYAIFNDQNFNDMLTNHIVSFEQLGLVCFPVHQTPSKNAVSFEGKNLPPMG